MSAPRPFPLVPRRRFLGVQFGRRRTSRRGSGDEIAGTRPYRPGDPVATIHWAASARLSAARGSDEFVVREFFADQAPRVALVHDRGPGMAIHAPPSPWLDKRRAADTAGDLIELSARAEHGEVVGVDAHDGGVALALEALLRRPARLPGGSFVFVVSDFLVPVPASVWTRLRSFSWDVVPVIVQDPVWEQSFPAVGGVVLPLADPVTGRAEDVWISSREARERKRANERRIAELLARFRRLLFDPVLVDDADPLRVGARFHAWAERRRRLAQVQA